MKWKDVAPLLAVAAVALVVAFVARLVMSNASDKPPTLEHGTEDKGQYRDPNARPNESIGERPGQVAEAVDKLEQLYGVVKDVFDGPNTPRA